MTQLRFQGKHAVVIGGSMAGMMAARVLAGHFQQVTVLERDVMEDGPAFRKGVPQARHTHALLIRGQMTLSRLFPGFVEGLVESGALVADSGLDTIWFHHGVTRLRPQTDLPVYLSSRPLLESVVRRHLRRVPNVRLLDGMQVERLLARADGRQVTGVEIAPVAGGPTQQLEADLVVDAAGRGSRTPQWLEDLGCGSVDSTHVKINLTYASRIYACPEDLPDWKLHLQFSEAPGTRGGMMFRMEGNQWMVTLQGYFNDAPPTDEEGFMAFARSLPFPTIAAAIENAKPLSPVSAFKVPSGQRRHYERLARFPEGFVCLGDAACSFNPVYGQGMTTAALGADTLDECLQELPAGSLAGLSRKFQRRLAKVIDDPWLGSSAEDLGFPQTEGKRTFVTRLVAWYMHRIHRLSSVDREVLIDLYKVMHMLKRPTALFKPRHLAKVLFQKV